MPEQRAARRRRTASEPTRGVAPSGKDWGRCGVSASCASDTHCSPKCAATRTARRAERCLQPSPPAGLPCSPGRCVLYTQPKLADTRLYFILPDIVTRQTSSHTVRPSTHRTADHTVLRTADPGASPPQPPSTHCTRVQGRPCRQQASALQVVLLRHHGVHVGHVQLLLLVLVAAARGRARRARLRGRGGGRGRAGRRRGRRALGFGPGDLCAARCLSGNTRARAPPVKHYQSATCSWPKHCPH